MSETKKELLIASVVVSARRWKDARRAFLDLPAGDPSARSALALLSSAEDTLQRWTIELERYVTATRLKEIA